MVLCCRHIPVLQILHEQEVLTTERTRKLLLKIVIEGYLSDSESVSTWDRKLQDLMREHEEDPNVNRILWNALTAQVPPHLPCPRLVSVSATVQQPTSGSNVVNAIHEQCSLPERSYSMLV